MPDEILESLKYAKEAAQLANAVGTPGLIGKLKSVFSRSSTVERDWKTEALDVLRENALNTLSNVEITVEQAFLILGNDFDWDNLSEPPQTWTNQWISAASKVGANDEERRTWWARLLAGEIQQSGSFSVRTISIMDILSTDEAQLFAKLSSYVWTDYSSGEPILILPRDDSPLWKPSVNQGLELQAAGVVTRQAAGYSTPLSQDEVYAMRIGTTTVLLTTAQTGQIRRGPLVLTEAGRQIWRLTDFEIDQTYVDALIEEWSAFGEISFAP